MIKYPIIFSAEVCSSSEMQAPWSINASGFETKCAIPLEFDGDGGALSPEDLFLLALSNCFVATFKVYAKNSKLKYDYINIKSNLSIGKNESNQIMANGSQIFVSVDGAEQPQRIKTILDKVARSGFLLNSVKTEIKFEFEINGEKIND